MKRFQVRYSGRVQGVGFRATTRDAARTAGVTGWVRNEADGTVLAEAQGTEERLTAFFDDLATRMSRNITGVNRNEIGVVEGETGFEITFF